MDKDSPEGVEHALTLPGRKRRAGVKISPREERAIGTVSEVTGVGISTLLHTTRVADLVKIYDGYIDRLKE